MYDRETGSLTTAQASIITQLEAQQGHEGGEGDSFRMRTCRVVERPFSVSPHLLFMDGMCERYCTS